MKKLLKIRSLLFIFLGVISLLLSNCKKDFDWPKGMEGKFLYCIQSTFPSVTYLIDDSGINEIYNHTYAVGPEWAPDGSKFLLALGESYTFVIMNAQRKTLNIVDGDSPIFSGNGLQIAFIDHSSGLFDSVCVSSSNGTGKYYLSLVPKFTDLIEWSPDGTKIAIDKDVEIYPNLVSDSIGFADENGFIFLTKGYNPCWSLDGSQMYYIKDNAFWNITLSDHSVYKLVDLPEELAGYEWFNLYSFSPDRTKIAFELYHFDSDVVTVNVLRIDGSGSKEVFTIPSVCESIPRWSKDGTQIAFVNPDGITVINEDGSDARNLFIAMKGEEHIIAFDWHN